MYGLTRTKKGLKRFEKVSMGSEKSPVRAVYGLKYCSMPDAQASDWLADMKL